MVDVPGLVRRRGFLVAACTAGCAADTPAPPVAGDDALVTRWRTVIGGFIGPPGAAAAVPARPTGMFAKLMRPGALAVRGMDLLIADVGQQRLWRADALAGTLVGIAGAPVSPNTALALGPDLSAWVLDPPAGQVLRFGRDGRLLQTWRAGISVPTPVALALADGGATLLLADGLGAQWAEQRGPGGLVRLVAPERDGGRRVSGVDAIAVGREHVFVLDRLAGAVHRVQRDGRVLATLGQGELMQPVALAVDRHERVFVHDLQDGTLKLLHPGRAAEKLTAAALGVQQIGGLAIEGDLLAVADPLVGQVQLLRLGGMR